MSRFGLSRLTCVLIAATLAVGAFVASEAPAQAKKLKIGVIFDYTGPLAGGGSDLHALGAKIMIDHFAKKGGVDVLLIGPSDLSIELGVPLDYRCDLYQRALDKIAAAAAKHGIAAGMYFIPPGMDPNFFVQKGFRFFTMPWAPWAQAGIQNGLAEIKC